MQQQSEIRAEAGSQEQGGAAAVAPSDRPGEGKRGLAGLRGRLQHSLERAAERIGQRQIPKLLDLREPVERELRAIPERIQRVSAQASLVLELIDDFRSGTYRNIPWHSVTIAAGALLYSVSPGDVVPDVIPLLGSLDDAFVVALAMRLVRKDLERYCRFKGYDLAKYFG